MGTGALMALLTLSEVLLVVWAQFPLALSSPCLLNFDITPSHGILWAGPTLEEGFSAVDFSFLPSHFPCKMIRLDWTDSKSLPALIAHRTNKGATERSEQEPSLKSWREEHVTPHPVLTQLFSYKIWMVSGQS